MSKEIEFTGERVVPNRTCHAQTLSEHLIRYSLAAKYAKVEKILDVACGTGYGLKVMSMLGADIYGADIDQESLDFAEEYNIYRGYQSFYKIDFEKENLFERFYSDLDKGLDRYQEILARRKFDLITSFETIEHLDNPDLLLSGIRDCLKYDGKFIYSIPLQCPNNFHKIVYDFHGAYELIDKYFEHEEMFIQEGNEIVNFKRLNGNIDGLNKRGVFLVGVCHHKK